MALYAIGDVQGCDAELGTLLSALKFSPDRDCIWFVGDLVNRGPDSLKVLRIYTKQPGKPADMAAPFTCPVGSTVAEFAGYVHNDLEETVKSARVWGSGAFDGQTVGRDHILHEKDVVELHA